MGKREYREIISYLKVAMVHIIKWLSQPEKKSGSWQGSINHAQEKIKKIRNENPSIPDSYIKEKWDETFADALKKSRKRNGTEIHCR
jgi:hypothetical protein